MKNGTKAFIGPLITIPLFGSILFSSLATAAGVS
jgi:hypothetical protein